MRFPRVLAVALVAVLLLALALVCATPSGLPEVRLGRLLLSENARKHRQGERLPGTGEPPAEVWMAEFKIQVPSESWIWLSEGQIGVELIGVGGRWRRVVPMGDPKAVSSWGVSGGRTISRTTWQAFPPGVERCRITTGFRRATVQENGERMLAKWGISGRFPAVSGWVIRHLPASERWLECRREEALPGPVARVEADKDGTQATPALFLSQEPGAPVQTVRNE